MTSAPLNPLDVPPYQLQHLLAGVGDNFARPPGQSAQVRCAQALGAELYVGCSNGELLRFSIQSDSHTLLSRQTVVNERPIQEIVLLPSLSRALVLADHQVYIYTLPSLDQIPPTVIKPIRNVVTIAVDEQHLRRPPPVDPSHPVDPVDFCVIKRSAISLYSLYKERLFFQKEIPLPSGGFLARRTGKALCVADKAASMLPLMPLSQAQDGLTIKPCITVISDNEFLIASWMGASSLGVFITGDAEPVRGTLEWPAHPESISLNYPHIAALLPNETIEIHSVETQAIVQVVSAPADGQVPERKKLVASANGFFVPSSQRSDKLRKTPVRLVRRRGSEGSRKEEALGEVPAM
ncbi:uncharacterized protein B0H18DRAFT_1085579 [Fomitopsis serialis]|uniref:uncharacterized protein n=1 Tax=Fomitopsis serialis TaxID=139415 RepID=UPI002007B93E|nr:uncharacterized protein B0H18DRAFT_1085579 [Neoantrodia serialis]KAH9924078.1 hypothetical protein B0H18DRAFT_1085579 [Neoantrodia serialis]